jgi:hypothetical protein
MTSRIGWTDASNHVLYYLSTEMWGVLNQHAPLYLKGQFNNLSQPIRLAAMASTLPVAHRVQGQFF